MTFLIEGAEHEDFQAALSFVDEYDFSSSDATDELTTHRHYHHSSTSTSNNNTVSELEPLDDLDILEISSFVDQQMQMQHSALVPQTPPKLQLQHSLPSTKSWAATVPRALQRQFRPVLTHRNKKSVSPTPSSDGSVASSNSSNGSGDTTVRTAPVKKPITWDPNKARNERKGELVYLRKQVAELETQLSNVRAKKPRISPQIHPTLSSTATTPHQQQHIVAASKSAVPATHNAAAVNVWKALAARQHDKRVQAERENIRLKLVLENQLKIAKSLEEMILKKTSTKDMEKSVEKQRVTHVYAPTPDRSDSATFEELLAGVVAAHGETDAVFEANGLAKSETRSDAKVRLNGSNGIYLEVFAGKILPFDMRTTSDAVWQHFANPSDRRPYRHYYNETSETQETTDTLMESFNMILYANRTSAVFKVKRILRRYVEEDRVVIVWWAFIDPIELSDEPLSGVRFLEKGYILIKKPASVAGDFALLQTCYITTPVFTGEWTQEDHPRVGAITDFVLSSTESNISASHQMIEDVLLQQAMRGSSVL